MKKIKIKAIAVIFIIIFCVISSPVFAWELNGDVITINTDDSRKIDEVIVKGDVCIKNTDIKIKGDYALYYPRQKDITMEGNIEIINNDYNLYGTQLKGNLDTQKFLISGQAKFTGPDLKLGAKTMDLNNTSGIMTLKGDPCFEYKELEASADKIIYYRQKKEALLEGNVTGKRDDQEFTATKLAVNMAEEQIKLSGQAKLIFSDGGED